MFLRAARLNMKYEYDSWSKEKQELIQLVFNEGEFTVVDLIIFLPECRLNLGCHMCYFLEAKLVYTHRQVIFIDF